ncbi:hypothetical protein ACIOC1_00440 [Streptomyces sp. NPDC088197]|uniref:hypothetical protein n=1 Tax=Streptomyces sp. NPDC088197 TaxID=3365840 RepID=UPI003823C35C
MTSDVARADLAVDTGTGPAQQPYNLAWYGADLTTGGIIEELAGVTLTQPLGLKVGAATTSAVSLNLAGAPRGWQEATTPGRCMLVAVDTVTDTPLWAGSILPTTGGSASTLDISLATLEAYFDRRFPGDVAMVQQDQAVIATAVMGNLFVDGPCFVLDAPPTGVLADYAVADSDDKSILSCMQELMGQGGPEFTVDVEWAPGHTGFVLPIRVRPSIGVQTDQPEGTFDFPGSVTDYTLTHTYEAGQGATVVVARGEGEGAARLTSAVHVAADLIAAGWPRYVYRYTPASGVTSVDQLDAHAAAALAMMRLGGQAWTVQATASRAPRIGADWRLGDSVRLAVETSPRHPDGTDVVARAWAWQLDPGADTITPILIEEG